MADSPIQLVVVTPEATVLDVQADFVAAPLFDGEVGIEKNHAPLIGRLGYGELRYKLDGQTTRFFLEGGFMQVSSNVVSVMTGRAIPFDEIDVAEARRQLEEALARPAKGPEAAARDRDISQARGMLRMVKTGSAN